MPSITLSAHFDGHAIVLDEPFEFPNNAQLLVTVVAPATDFDRDPWVNLGGAGLAGAYGDDDPEYTPADVRCL